MQTACSVAAEKKTDDGIFDIVTSFYPMQIIAMNLAGDIDGVSVSSMSQPDIGCIHDHVFTTGDLRIVENADVYIENGLGLETFNGRLLEAYPELTIIEAGAFVSDAPTDEDGDPNGHVWTSIDDYVLEINEVADALASVDPSHAAQYERNRADYVYEVRSLADEYSDVISGLKGRGVLVLDESLPSLCVYLGMDYMTIETDHEQEALSAGVLREIIEKMNEDGVDLIFTGIDSDTADAAAIAAETGASVISLDPLISGQVRKDAYLDGMRSNLEILSELV